ncbi:MAG: hypothetical protein BWY53_00485 [Parcubacteria group bacterium ADurb.Bin326]|nr:MAG: hypothetical protein BWY53_00485 [Parcubacteria group bacterium ADurb.Bin326]
MKITVNVKANAKETKLELLPSGSYKASVKAPALEGKANEAVKKLLAEYFGVSQSEVSLKAGQKAKNKVFSVGG